MPWQWQQGEAGHRQLGLWEQPEAAFAAPGQFVFPGGAVPVSGMGAQRPGQVPAGRVSLTSCLGFVQGFQPLAMLLICFLLSHISGPSLELVAGMSPVCPGKRVSQLWGVPEGGSWGSPLHHISAPVALAQECLVGHVRALPVATTATEQSPLASRPSQRNKAEGEGFKGDAGVCAPGPTSSSRDALGHPLRGWYLPLPPLQRPLVPVGDPVPGTAVPGPTGKGQLWVLLLRECSNTRVNATPHSFGEPLGNVLLGTSCRQQYP